MLKIKKYVSHAHKIEIECDTLKQVKESLEAKADIIMLDNMKPDQLKKMVKSEYKPLYLLLLLKKFSNGIKNCPFFLVQKKHLKNRYKNICLRFFLYFF